MSTDDSFDLNRKYVRVTHVRPEGLVEFDFAIGEPDLVVEMILTPEAFQEFCENNAVIVLPPDEGSNAMDQLGIAQYLSRIGLLLGDVEGLDAGKQAWLEAPEWQELRRSGWAGHDLGARSAQGR